MLQLLETPSKHFFSHTRSFGRGILHLRENTQTKNCFVHMCQCPVDLPTQCRRHNEAWFGWPFSVA